MQSRMAVALGLSTALHAGFVWMLGDATASSAAPAQRTMTVSMAPAAARPVLNSIAPSSAALIAPSAVRPIAPPRVPVIDAPETTTSTHAAGALRVIEPRAVMTLAPEKTLNAREDATRLPAAITTGAKRALAKVDVREAAARPAPPESAAEARKPETDADEVASRRIASAAARAARAAEPARRADAAAASGMPGADRVARPASGNEPPRYPWSARVHGDEGRVVVSVWVSARGEAERLAVLRSSGYAALDRAALEAVGHWRFEPARRGGADTASLLYVPVIFRLE